MRQSALAKRYAGALFQTAKEAGAVDAVESDLGLITYTLESNPNLREVIVHPLIPSSRKKEIVASVFADNVQDMTLDFLYLTIDKRREAILPDVEVEYVALANEYRNVAIVQVTAAVQLSPPEIAVLRDKLESFIGKQVEIQLSESPELIGGLVVQIGDTVIDGSVKGYLTSLREKLLGKE